METTMTKSEPTNQFNKLPIFHPDPAKKYSEKEEKYLREVLNYEFVNVEQAGMAVSFGYGDARNKAKFTLVHGSKYKFPRFLARHVESVGTPMYGWKPDGSGQMQKTEKGRKPRFQMREVY